MKFRHLVRFTRSRYFTVDYDVYRMSMCIHFSHLVISTSQLNFIFRKKNVFVHRGKVDSNNSVVTCDMNHQVTMHIMRQTINNFFYMFYCHRKSFEYLTLIRKKVSAYEIAKIK